LLPSKDVILSGQLWPLQETIEFAQEAAHGFQDIGMFVTI
jgi:hypothetical protein